MESLQGDSKQDSPIHTAWKIVPTFLSTSIPRTQSFYADILGFQASPDHPDPNTGVPSFLSVAAGKHAAANIYFHLCRPQDDRPFTPSSTRIFTSTRGLEDLWKLVIAFSSAQNQGMRLEISKSICNEPWGYREFTIQDPDKNQLTFCRFLEGGNPGDDTEEHGTDTSVVE